MHPLGLTLCLGLMFSIACGGHARTPEDIARDATSKPHEVLTFMGVQRGWHVLDLFAGNGYYSEVLSERVGPDGQVYLHNNQAYMAFAKALPARLKDGRLPNVTPYPREIEDIDITSNSLDMVLMVMTYHDVYFEQNGWTVTADPTFAVIRRILKPGGILAIVDHHAPSGSDRTYVQNQHRIDADFARQDIAARGFEFVAGSNILANAHDDLQHSVFNDDIRGRTSRFVVKFRKPAPN